jgi:NAD(P)-dependent dehydrogenase (short-subunit alcohol dehydrogenase family)
MNKYDFEGRSVVITGGAGGSGKVIAARLLGSGARVCLWDIDAAALDEAAGDLGDRGKLSVKTVDVVDGGAVRGAVDEVAGALGCIDGLVHCAGITGPTVAGNSWA